MLAELLVGDLPGAAVPHLTHRSLVLEAIIQPEGRDQVVEPLDAARRGGQMANF